MPRGLARGKQEAFKNLKLDNEFFKRMLKVKEDGSNTGSKEAEEFRDFDVYLMEKSVMPLLLQGLDALSRHMDSITSKGTIPSDGRPRFNPLVWLAQYMLRNHPKYVKDHRTPMYERFSELANIERGRRCLLRRKEQMEEVWKQLVEENGANLKLKEITKFLKTLDSQWYLDGALLEKMPQDFLQMSDDILSNPVDSAQRDDAEVLFVDFWRWFENFVKTNDILRASAFSDAENRKLESEQKAKKAEEDFARRSRALEEAMKQRSELEEQFEAVTADMYISNDIARILNKGAVIDGVEEKEGGPPLQGEHIVLIRFMLGIWGCPVNDDTEGDIWNDTALAAWQLWLKERGVETSRGVDKNLLQRLMNKDAFEEYLQQAYPVRDENADDDYVKQIVEVRCFLEDDIDLMVEAVDEDTGEMLHLALPDSEADTLRKRLVGASTNNPVLAMADRVSGRVIELLPE